VLVDILMPDGIALVRRLSAERPELKVVALAVRELEDNVLQVAEAGVAGYVTCDASLAELAHTLASVARDELVLSPRMTAALMRRVAVLAHERVREPVFDTLTVREREIVDLLGRGLSNKEIGQALQIELATVKNHVHHILEKLHVTRRSQVAMRVQGARDAPLT
jgi:DNA-binding NarL/FixJ family response regulator